MNKRLAKSPPEEPDALVAHVRVCEGPGRRRPGLLDKKIEILGIGCPKCNALAENVRKALQETNQAAEVVKVTDIKEMIARGVMFTPALLVDGKVVSQGKALSVEQIKELIK